VKRIREYNQPIMRFKSCYKCLKWFHDLERPRKITRLYSTKIGDKLAIEVNLLEIRSLINCLNPSQSDAKRRLMCSLDDLESEIRSAFDAERVIRMGFVAKALSHLTEIKNTERMNIKNKCGGCWPQFGFSAIATWNF
jgi:hypothetical protein